jgi:hypothetical protein
VEELEDAPAAAAAAGEGRGTAAREEARDGAAVLSVLGSVGRAAGKRARGGVGAGVGCRARRCVAVLDWHVGEVHAQRALAAGWPLASGGGDRLGAVLVWAAGAGGLVAGAASERALEGHRREVLCLAAWDGDGGSDGGSSGFGDAVVDEVAAVVGGGDGVGAVDVCDGVDVGGITCGGGGVLLSGSVDRTVRVWCVMTGAQLATLRGHAGAVTALATAPAARLLASASEDRTVRLWALGTGQGGGGAWAALRTVEAYGPDAGQFVLSLAVSSRQLVGGSYSEPMGSGGGGGGALGGRDRGRVRGAGVGPGDAGAVARAAAAGGPDRGGTAPCGGRWWWRRRWW